MIPEILATLACGIFAGAAIYVSAVEQPARLSCGIALAIAEWRPSYRRGTAMQASLLFAVIPFTFLVIFPTNKKLQSVELDVTSAEAERLLRLWGRLHAVRGVLSLLAFAVFLYALKSKGS